MIGEMPKPLLECPRPCSKKVWDSQGTQMKTKLQDSSQRIPRFQDQILVQCDIQIFILNQTIKITLVLSRGSVTCTASKTVFWKCNATLQFRDKLRDNRYQKSFFNIVHTLKNIYLNISLNIFFFDFKETRLLYQTTCKQLPRTT